MNQQNYTDRPTMAKWNELVQAVGAMPKVQWGSYVGDGICGQEHPRILNVGFAPQIVFIESKEATGQKGGLVWLRGWTQAGSGRLDRSYTVNITWTDSGLSFWGTTVDAQLSFEGRTYYWCAIG